MPRINTFPCQQSIKVLARQGWGKVFMEVITRKREKAQSLLFK